jgi:E3 ubiquitin-protein ligase MYCBP2
VEGLSSGEWGGGGSGQDRPSCDNHDDGETPAIILCDSCGNLCSDCDRLAHLLHYGGFSTFTLYGSVAEP